VLGGTQSLHTNARDEALGLPTEESARLALRTQQILAHESGVADVIDPLGGSPYVEALTDEVEGAALALMDQVEQRGGAVEAVQSGFVQREIHRSALEWQRAVERGQRVIVGVNRFQVDEEPPEIFRPDDDERERVSRDLAAARERRDSAAVEAALSALERATTTGENLMHPILEAVDRYATVGEICKVLERAFGRYRPPEVL